MTATPKKRVQQSRKAVKARPSPVVALTPNTKKAKKSAEVAILKAAANDVLQMRNNTGTRGGYGGMNKVLKRYHTIGHLFVTRGKIQFQIAKTLKALQPQVMPPSAQVPVNEVWFVPGSAATATSGLSSFSDGSQPQTQKNLREKLELNVADLRALVKGCKIDGDSPMKTTRQGLEEQWKRRSTRAIDLFAAAPNC
jgi:hypothetical protein